MNKIHHKQIRIPITQGVLNAFFSVPKDPKGVIIFVHGSGSSRWSPRNQYVADFLEGNQFATLLIDLLTEKEEQEDKITEEYRFNIPHLIERTRVITQWIRTLPEVRGKPIGYFGASTGAAAALGGAVQSPTEIFAIVSRGGRPDLSTPILPSVKSPTLLIVGEKDPEVLELNVQALNLLTCEKKLEIIPGATHLFSEPGTLESVAKLAADWFTKFSIQSFGNL